MAKQRPYRGLTFKMVAALLLSALAAVVFGLLFRLAGQLLIREIYLSPERSQARADADIASFRSFVSLNQVASSDAVSIGAWNREHPYVRLTVSGRDTLVTSDSYGAELVLASSALSLRTGSGVPFEYSVNFSDGAYGVTVYNFYENSLLTTVDVLSVVAAALLFLVCSTLYDRSVTRSIQRLSRQVRQVSQGDLKMQIVPRSQDEIGSLAADVDAMRLSIIRRLQSEEVAWAANSSLITAISHDVRTPLTALMGYLDILSDETLDDDTRRAYLDICRHNADRLKDLTDELFHFFLVFGQARPDQHLEELDAATLLDQILIEAQAELTQQGFDVRLIQSQEVHGAIRVDVGHLRRCFDNLFSNLRKYADRSRPVTMLETVEDGKLHISISNFVGETVGRVESTKIGLKTCQKLLTAMGGAFNQSRQGDSFTAEMELPLV